ncbi:MAG: YigZ family protein [Myxococcales bacterium]|nr:YigZ family protein [Myxococcales bacterium]
MGKPRYPIPAEWTRVETMEKGSRFIATGQCASTVKDAEAFVASIRSEFPDATHNCPAFRVGYGNTITEWASDDGEPSGTAGRPMLSVLQGQDLGDVVVVVTRYFGGTKLGTGGLVRAYSGAVKAWLDELPVKMQVECVTRLMSVDYGRYAGIKELLAEYEAEITEEDFGGDISLTFSMPVDRIEEFDAVLTDTSLGQLIAMTLEEN